MFNKNKSDVAKVEGKTISKTGEKEIRKIEGRKKAEITNAKNAYDREIQAMAKDQEKLKKAAEKAGENTEVKQYVLLNIGQAKEFIKYGANKVVDQIKIRKHADIEIRTALEKAAGKKSSLDMKQVLFYLLLATVIGVIVLVLVTNLLNYQTVQNENMAIKAEMGTVQGQLANCNVQLGRYTAEENGGGSAPPPSSTEKLVG